MPTLTEILLWSGWPSRYPPVVVVPLLVRTAYQWFLGSRGSLWCSSGSLCCALLRQLQGANSSLAGGWLESMTRVMTVTLGIAVCGHSQRVIRVVVSTWITVSWSHAIVAIVVRFLGSRDSLELTVTLAWQSREQ